MSAEHTDSFASATTTSFGNDNKADSKTKPIVKLQKEIQTLTERTRSAKEELTKLATVTGNMRSQVESFEQEVKALEEEERQTKEDTDGVMTRIDYLLAEKAKMEQRLEELKAENTKLDAFLKQLLPSNLNASSTTNSHTLQQSLNASFNQQSFNASFNSGLSLPSDSKGLSKSGSFSASINSG